MPGKAAHRPAVLARHHARAVAVDREPGNVARRELGCHALDLKKFVDRQAAKPVAFARKAWVRGWACMPAHQTTVAASMRSPVARVAPSWSMPRPRRRAAVRCRAPTTPRRSQHALPRPYRSRSRLPVGDDDARRARRSAERARNLPGISAATSIPVSPPPMTSAVHWPGTARGWQLRMCWFSRTPAS